MRGSFRRVWHGKMQRREVLKRKKGAVVGKMGYILNLVDLWIIVYI